MTVQLAATSYNQNQQGGNQADKGKGKSYAESWGGKGVGLRIAQSHVGLDSSKPCWAG